MLDGTEYSGTVQLDPKVFSGRMERTKFQVMQRWRVVPP